MCPTKPDKHVSAARRAIRDEVVSLLAAGVPLRVVVDVVRAELAALEAEQARRNASTAAPPFKPGVR